MNQFLTEFWSISADEMLKTLNTNKSGLTNIEAGKRLLEFGSNLLKPRKRTDVFTLVISQFKSPIILILFIAIGLSFFLNDPVDAFIILLIVVVSGLLGFWQEHSASDAVEKLLSMVQIKASVIREGVVTEISVEQIVPEISLPLRQVMLFQATGYLWNQKTFLLMKPCLQERHFLLKRRGQSYPKKRFLVRGVTLCGWVHML
jgi:hypothetical protein